jgi:hypothetical protein
MFCGLCGEFFLYSPEIRSFFEGFTRQCYEKIFHYLPEEKIYNLALGGEEEGRKEIKGGTVKV